MDVLTDFTLAHPFWIWVAVGAVLLAIELPTGTGWLLWPSACAFVVAVMALVGVPASLTAQVAVYAVLTIVTTLLSRRFMPRRAHTSPDINDRTSQLLGKTGLAVGAFQGGAGRVLVDGAEWEAELDDGQAPAPGGKVEVVRVLGGARLSVRPL
jgi:membrane protein implicated in regulation of membrane protease activity